MEQIDEYSNEDSLMEVVDDRIDYEDRRLLLFHMLSGVLKDLNHSRLSIVLGAHQFLLNKTTELEIICDYFNVDYKRIVNWYTSLSKVEIRTLVNDFKKLSRELKHETRISNI